ncbi:unnamed protein product [Peronospora destructor]|uniref:Uncharacterized protein n=1 Tax=Peronospora destructor TaxID=86335 RepID=A0AAV0UEM6_9STRA|nr:unnamed protein product [Peronospora destructor]
MFGALNIGAMHGLILTAWSIGGVVGGITFNNTYSDQIADGWDTREAYIYTVRRILIIVIVGFVFLFSYVPKAPTVLLQATAASLFGRRVINIKGKQGDNEGGEATCFSKMDVIGQRFIHQ